MWDREVEELLEPHDRRRFLKGAGATGITALAGCLGGSGGSSGGGSGAGTDAQTDVTEEGNTAGSGSAEGSPANGETTTTSRSDSNGSGTSGSANTKEFPIPDNPSNHDMLDAVYIIDDLIHPEVELPGWGDGDTLRFYLGDTEGIEEGGIEAAPSANGTLVDALGFWDDVTKYAGFRSQPTLFYFEDGAPNIETVKQGSDLTQEEEIQGLPVYTGTFDILNGEREAGIVKGEDYLLIQIGLEESVPGDLLKSLGYFTEEIFKDGNPMFDEFPDARQAAENSNGFDSVKFAQYPNASHEPEAQSRTRAVYSNAENGEWNNETVNFYTQNGDVREEPE